MKLMAEIFNFIVSHYPFHMTLTGSINGQSGRLDSLPIAAVNVEAVDLASVSCLNVELN
jgi:hypothetical protein